MSLRSRWLLSVIGAITASSAFAASYIVPPDDVLIRKAQGIVTARATTTWVEESTGRGIETVTEFAVEEVLKGDVPHTFRIRTPGGKFGKTTKIVPGSPHFNEGEQQLLFINARPETDDYITTDFGLGHFMFAYDDSGRRLAIRAEGGIFGWDLGTNQPHQEQRRDAGKFIEYVRAISAGGEAPPPDYFVPKRPLLGKTSNSTETQHKHPIVALACSFPSCSATSYTLASNPPDEDSVGLRWAVFPTAVNWNQGNTEPGAPNGGTDAINAAFGAWNGDTKSNVNYFLATSNSNTNGITNAPDMVNNIVFEHDFGSNYVCGAGGLLGLGGLQTSSGTNMVGSETFASTTEADVSMNKGIANCTSLFNSGDFNSAVTHEVGHTLGFRHSDKNRADNAACSTDTNLECTSSAIMNSTVPNGLMWTLQSWDHNAVQSVYPAPPCTAPSAPTGVGAIAASSTSVSVTWNASSSGSLPINYQVQRSSAGTGGFGNVGGTTTGTAFTDSGLSVTPTAYLYRVVATNSCGSATSAYNLATTIIYTEDPLVAGSTVIKAVHLTELRTAVNAVRKLANNGVANDYSFTDPTITQFSTVVKAVHVTDLRTALDQAMSTLGLTTGGYTNALSAGVLIRAVDFQEIRTRMK